MNNLVQVLFFGQFKTLMHLDCNDQNEEMTFPIYQGMHSSANSTIGCNWFLRECFKLVHLRDEMPMAS